MKKLKLNQCATCKYFVGHTIYAKLFSPKELYSFCHRYPQKVNVESNYVCGEYKKRK